MECTESRGKNALGKTPLILYKIVDELLPLSRTRQHVYVFMSHALDMRCNFYLDLMSISVLHV